MLPGPQGLSGIPMTKFYRIAPVIALAGLGLAMATSAANAQANCDWYARTALKQQQDNERMKCGFKGDAWSADLKAHAAWCSSVSPDAWKEQAKKRDQELAACVNK